MKIVFGTIPPLYYRRWCVENLNYKYTMGRNLSYHPDGSLLCKSNLYFLLR